MRELLLLGGRLQGCRRKATACNRGVKTKCHGRQRHEKSQEGRLHDDLSFVCLLAYDGNGVADFFFLFSTIVVEGGWVRVDRLIARQDSAIRSR